MGSPASGPRSLALAMRMSSHRGDGYPAVAPTLSERHFGNAMLGQREQDLIRDALYGRLGHAPSPRHVGRLPQLAAAAAAKASRSDAALEAGEMLLALDGATDDVTAKYGRDGSRVLWGILGSVEATASSHIEGEGTSLRLDDMREAVRAMEFPSGPDRRVRTDVDIGAEPWVASERRSVLQCAGATRRLLTTGASFLEVCRAHEILMCGQPAARPGVPRGEGHNVVIQDRLGRVVFAPPPGGDDIPAMLEELIAWTADRCNAAKGKEPLERYRFISAVSGVAHLRFESVHPFNDGNGRIGRSLAESIVATARPHFDRILPVGIAAAFSEPMQRSAYYAALSRDDETDFAVWWCEQMVGAVRIALGEIEHAEIDAEVATLRERITDHRASGE